MPFGYYEHLTKRQQATYRRSDAIGALVLPSPERLAESVEAMRAGLLADDRRRVATAVRDFARTTTAMLQVPPVKTEVLARRPSDETAELHGLYTREEGRTALVQVWMRTAAHERPVAHRTFLRTVVHELCHHLDFELYRLEDTFHTQGFFRRESSIVRQLLGEGGGGRGRQLALFD